MEKATFISRAWLLVRSLLTAYVTTALMLLFLALLVFKLELDESKVGIGIILVYVISCFLGGFAAGKSGKTKKFLWGLFTGTLYFLILTVVSMCAGGISSGVLSTVTTAALCLGSGMLGGMTA